MQSFAAALVLAAAGATAVPSQPPPQPAPLRQVLRQYHPGSATATPRELTAVERAVLRRQLVEQGAAGGRR